MTLVVLQFPHPCCLPQGLKGLWVRRDMVLPEFFHLIFSLWAAILCCHGYLLL